MKKLLEGVGVILVLQGLGGVVHGLTGWFHYWVVVRYLGFLDGYEMYASIVLAVIGAALVIASDAVKAEAARE
ncbi:hypothetical protein FGW37_03815 [Streptomyces rectiverticillatus]|uniref:hypothetical protein n=1 Tax=Streptomyces rectiverticillatus TaxID=173860 RepID=UPI0015C3B568|nr:hypothetical protein [Streptomyces rectiverticillatus]QLE70841.1 hypothetical protein FGW37_03815 [Streptomyces rectiverticillatus]